MNDQSVFSHPRQKRHLKSSPDKIEIEKHLGKRIWANGILAQFKDYSPEWIKNQTSFN